MLPGEEREAERWCGLLAGRRGSLGVEGGDGLAERLGLCGGWASGEMGWAMG